MLTFLGDVFVSEIIKNNCGVFPDYVINLEAPITSAENGYPGKINLKTDRNNLPESFGSKPLAVCLANNHIMDFGREGYHDTITDLTTHGIGFFGAGNDGNNFNNPFICRIRDVKIALLGYVCASTNPVYADGDMPGVTPITIDKVLSDVALAKSLKAERIVVSLHWGAENVSLPKPEDVKTARKIIDCGADLIIGHHAHRIQPWEIYQGKYIFYGLGNCVFPELSVPAAFEDGKPGIHVLLRQHGWNRKSLAVEYDVNLEKVYIRKLKFNGANLNCSGYIQQKKLFSVFSFSGYSSVYQACYLYDKFKLIIAGYLKNKKKLSFEHIKIIFNLIKNYGHY